MFGLAGELRIGAGLKGILDDGCAHFIPNANGIRQPGNLLEKKRKALGKQYQSREQFIYNRSDELFGSEDWISLRHLYNIEHGKNWFSIEKPILLADALEEDPGDLFNEMVAIYRRSQI